MLKLKSFLFSVIIVQQWLFLGAIPDCKSYQSVRSNCETRSIGSPNQANPKEFPFTALLFRKDENDIKWFCVGTLISSRFVLTVAHCFYNKDLPNGVRLGELDYNSTDDGAAPIDFGIKSYTLHPNHSRRSNLNDIALVELDAEVQFSDHIMPACLPVAADHQNFTKFTGAGWNLRHTVRTSTHLLTAKIDQVDEAKCLPEHRSWITLNATLQICAGSSSDDRTDCQFTSGSPIFVDHPDYKCMAMVMGVIAHGLSDCAETGTPNFYTRVPGFIDWIKSIV